MGFLKIALISYEYPPDTGIGGIATYFFQLSNLLQHRGHYVEVFSASYKNEISEDEGNGFLVHRIITTDKYSFKKDVVSKFAERQKVVNFDLFESPEYMADGLLIKLKFPELPLVVKLHTPDFLVKELNGLKLLKPSFFKRLQFIAGAYRRFKKPGPYWWKYYYQQDVEYQLIQLAELICTPSVSLGEIIAKKWKISPGKIVNIPYSFSASKKTLDIPVETDTKIISYIGRLEVRKGVAIFSKVIPLVAKKIPGVKFRLIGKDLPSPYKDISMKVFLKRELKGYENNVEFIDHSTPEEINHYLSETDICVFPSIWENFPNVCLEAMSAGRAIIASKNGGMNDMLTNPIAGILVDPKSEKSIADSIIQLMQNSSLRYQLGANARESVLLKYNADRIGKLTEKYYETIIKNKGKATT